MESTESPIYLRTGIEAVQSGSPSDHDAIVATGLRTEQPADP